MATCRGCQKWAILKLINNQFEVTIFPEIPLEHREVCNVAETLPTMCPMIEDWLDACEYATFYCSTVALLPTHQPSTNRVVARNRRIGVSIIDVSGWKEEFGVSKLTRYMRDGYKLIRKVNKRLADEAGVPESIRVTTINKMVAWLSNQSVITSLYAGNP